jgi:hypothetical protein
LAVQGFGAVYHYGKRVTCEQHDNSAERLLYGLSGKTGINGSGSCGGNGSGMVRQCSVHRYAARREPVYSNAGKFDDVLGRSEVFISGWMFNTAAEREAGSYNGI